MTAVAWSDARTDRLRVLFEAGRSAAEIAVDLGGGITRNAVIGKLHRIGLRKDKKPKVARRPRDRVFRPRQPATPAIARQRVEEPVYCDDYVPPAEQRRSLLELDGTNCHWPIGHPGEPDFHFCGGEAFGPGPYCAHHARIAYVPASDRRHRYNLKGNRW
jgi:GcrA cell cycle regulator